MELKAVSFNIRCCNDGNGNTIAERAPRLLRIIEKYSPDVIGIQEYRPNWKPFFKEYFEREYAVYNKYRGDSESVPILWKRNRFNCLKEGTFWLSDTPERESGGWDERYAVNRICSYAVLKEKMTGTAFCFMNTHFGFGDNCQKKSSELIYDYSEKISNLPTFITGDFNMTPESVGYSTIVKYFIDVNAVTSKDMGTTYHGYAPEKIKNAHIDYCFIDKKIKPLNQSIIRDTVASKYPSDHYGLFIELDI